MLQKNLLLLGVLLISQAHATANLGIWPMRISLTPDQKTNALHLINKGTTPVRVRITARALDMDENGRFIQTDTGNFTFFPRLTTIAPSQDRAIRVGYIGKFPRIEKAYRLIVKELPPLKQNTPRQQSKQTTIGIQSRLEFSLPLFVMPTANPPQPRAQIVQAKQRRKTTLRLGINNPDNYHILIKEVALSWLNKKGKSIFTKKYPHMIPRILPQRRLFLDIPLGKEASSCSSARTLEIKIKLGRLNQPYRKIFSLKKRSCVPVIP